MKMEKRKINTENNINVNKSNSVDLFKVATNTLLIIAGTWVVLKISKEILKELEGMGF